MNNLASYVTEKAEVSRLPILSSYHVKPLPILMLVLYTLPAAWSQVSPHTYLTQCLSPSFYFFIGTFPSVYNTLKFLSFDSQIQSSSFLFYSSFAEQLSLLPTSQFLFSSLLPSLPWNWFRAVLWAELSSPKSICWIPNPHCLSMWWGHRRDKALMHPVIMRNQHESKY